MQCLRQVSYVLPHPEIKELAAFSAAEEGGKSHCWPAAVWGFSQLCEADPSRSHPATQSAELQVSCLDTVALCKAAG